jgi:hypothetical protein
MQNLIVSSMYILDHLLTILYSDLLLRHFIYWFASLPDTNMYIIFMTFGYGDIRKISIHKTVWVD